MEVNLYNQKGESVDKVNIPDKVFGLSFNADLVHQVLIAQSANSRQVLAHTKGRGEVRGGGKKPWRQKGTGRARHGSIRSPIWKGGGVAFGPTKERNFSKDINKKMKRSALFMTLSSKVKDEQFAVLDSINLPQMKTKEALNVFNSVSKIFAGYKSSRTKRDSVLTVIAVKDRSLEKSFNNLPSVSVIEARNLNLRDVLKYKYLLMTKDAIGAVEKTFIK